MKPREILHISDGRLVFANDPREARRRAENRERVAKSANGTGYKWLADEPRERKRVGNYNMGHRGGQELKRDR